MCFKRGSKFAIGGEKVEDVALPRARPRGEFPRVAFRERPHPAPLAAEEMVRAF
jgi:hypothetical protein